MRLFEDLPVEVQEQIFIKLNAKDLTQCSLVCLKWREIINSNRIWLKICEMEGFAEKRWLKCSERGIQNPLKQYSEVMHFAPLCHWKSHFNRYKYLETNWKNGRYVTLPTTFKPFYMSDRFIVEISNSSLKISEMCGTVKERNLIPLEVTEDLDNLVSDDRYIVYTQRRQMFCLKKERDSFKITFQVELETENCCHFRPCRTTMLDQTIFMSTRFVLVLNPAAPCSLTFYGLSQMKVSRKFDLHQILKNPKRFSRTCCEVVDDKVFVCYNTASDSFLMKYDYVRNTWDSPIELDSVAVSIYSSKRFICVKMAAEDEGSPTSVWEISAPSPPVQVDTLFVSDDSPIVVTPNDFAIFFIHQEVFVKGLLSERVSSFTVPFPIVEFYPVLDKYMAILCVDGITVWDCTRGIKMYTVFRETDELIQLDLSLCVSDTNILFKWGRFAKCLSFW